MRIEESVSKTTIIGDIKSNTVSIDVNSIGFITQMLSTNLYSRPMESFLREIVSNAWDSHVEAGNEDPILLEVGTNSENRHFIRIQDFGTGLSPQRFDEIYKMIGSSTKRDSNDYIGAFGIGRFSALAYSDTVYLTSNYEGVKYKYLMYKDGDNINIDELFNAPTVDHNGLEVMVYLRNSNDAYGISQAISSQLIYFDNLYLNFDRYNSYELDGFDDRFNNLKIKKYKTFSVNTLNPTSRPVILLGKIQYPLDMGINYNTTFKFRGVCPIAIHFNIGELPTTPNREEIQYTQKAIETISKRLDEVSKELDELIEAQSTKDFKHLNKYIDFLNKEESYLILYENDDTTIKMSVPKMKYDVTLNGVKYSKNLLLMYNHIMSGGTGFNKIGLENSHVSFRIYNQRMEIADPVGYNIHISNMLYRYVHREGNNEIPKRIYIANRGNLNGIAKTFLREYADNDTIFIKESITWNKIVRNIMRNTKYQTGTNIYNKFEHDWNSEEFKIIIKYIGTHFSSIEKFTNDDVPQWFIDDVKTRRKSTVGDRVKSINWSEEVNLFVLRERETYTSGLRVTADSQRVSMDVVKKQWTGPIVYSFKDDIRLRRLFWTFYNIPYNRYGDNNKKHPFAKYKFVEIAPTKINRLEQFHNFINIEDFMNIKYKKLREIGTAKYLSDNFGYVENLALNKRRLDEISTTLSEVVTKVHDYIQYNLPRGYEIRETLTNEIYEMCVEHDYFDEEMRGYINKHKRLLENSRFITILANDSILPKGMINFTVDYAIKNKLFRPNIESVKKLRQETIFNNPVKKEEDENN